MSVFLQPNVLSSELFVNYLKAFDIAAPHDLMGPLVRRQGDEFSVESERLGPQNAAHFFRDAMGFYQYMTDDAPNEYAGTAQLHWLVQDVPNNGKFLMTSLYDGKLQRVVTALKKDSEHLAIGVTLTVPETGESHSEIAPAIGAMALFHLVTLEMSPLSAHFMLNGRRAEPSQTRLEERLGPASRKILQAARQLIKDRPAKEGGRPRLKTDYHPYGSPSGVAERVNVQFDLTQGQPTLSPREFAIWQKAFDAFQKARE